MTARHRAPSGGFTVPPRPGTAAAPGQDADPAGAALGDFAAQVAVGGSAAAAARVLRQAYAEIRATKGTPDSAAIACVVGTLAAGGADSLRNEAVSSALGRVGVDDLLSDPAGERTVALLIIEGELTSWIERGQPNDDLLADALTAYLVACNRYSAGLFGRERIVWAVEEYLHRKRRPRPEQASVAVHLMPETQRATWERLAERIKWLRWLGHEAFARGWAEVSAAELVDLLVLLRPRQRQYGDAAEFVPLPERFTRMYRVPELDGYGFTGPGADDASEGPLAQLALALDPLLSDPGKTARLVQSLVLPPPLAEAVGARLAVEQRHEAQREDLLAIRVDDATSPRVLAVNLSPSHPLSLRVGGHSLRLQPNAVSQPKAADYFSQPLRVRPADVVEVGDWRLPIDEPMPELTESGDITLSTIPPELFRGREQQLAVLRHGLGGRGPYAGRLIFGPRRAGKSTLMEYAGLDPRLRGKVSIDIGNRLPSVRDFAAWSDDVSAALVRAVGQELPGVTLEPGANFIETIQNLDDALAGGKPVALCLDEFDTLLLPEQQAAGRRAAANLGNRAFHNLLVMGTVQRFHRSLHEFKVWVPVECPADLSWADGVTYFLGPLADRRPRDRAEWLTRPGVTPDLFATEIEPRIGLRPYFWGKLRSGIESVFGAEPDRSRLVDAELLRRELARLLTHDQYLRQVTDSPAELSYLNPEELLSRDLFSVAEQTVLTLFARLPKGQFTVTAEAARAAGGQGAIDELIDRAYLTYHAAETRLRCAVPIFLDSLRAQARILEALTARPPARPAPTAAAAASTAPVKAAPGPATAGPPAPASPPPAPVPAAADAAGKPSKAEAAEAKAAPKKAPKAAAAPSPQQAKPAASGPQPSGSAEQAEQVRAAVASAGPPALPAGVTMRDIDQVRATVAAQLKPGATLTLSTLGTLIGEVAPAVRTTKYAGTGRLSAFVQVFLPEYDLHDANNANAMGYLTVPGAPKAAPAPASPPAPAKSVSPAATPPKAAPAKAAPAKATAAAAQQASAPQSAASMPAGSARESAATRQADIARVRAALLAKVSGGRMILLGDAWQEARQAAPVLFHDGSGGGESSFAEFLKANLGDFRVKKVNGTRMLAAPAKSASAEPSPAKPAPAKPAQPEKQAAPAAKPQALKPQGPKPPAASARPVAAAPARPAADQPAAAGWSAWRGAASARVRAALLAKLSNGSAMGLNDALRVARQAAPELFSDDASGGEKRFAEFVRTYLSDFRIETFSGTRMLLAPAKPSAADQGASTQPATRPAQAGKHAAATPRASAPNSGPAAAGGTPPARRPAPRTPAQDAADIMRLRAELLAALTARGVLTGADVDRLIVTVAPRLRRAGTWAGEPSLTAFLALHFGDLKIGGPPQQWYIRAPQQSPEGGWVKRLLGRLSPADQADEPADDWWN